MEESKHKNRSNVRALVLLNRELKERILMASSALKAKDEEMKLLRKNLRRAGNSVMEFEQDVRSVTGQLQATQQEKDVLAEQVRKLSEENELLKADSNHHKALAEKSKFELEKAIKTAEVVETEKVQQLTKQLSMSAMHSAGLEAQIKEMRAKHPGSELLRDTSQRLETGEYKSRLREIYEEAFSNKARNLGVTHPFDNILSE